MAVPAKPIKTSEAGKLQADPRINPATPPCRVVAPNERKMINKTNEVLDDFLRFKFAFLADFCTSFGWFINFSKFERTCKLENSISAGGRAKNFKTTESFASSASVLIVNVEYCEDKSSSIFVILLSSYNLPNVNSVVPVISTYLSSK